jgi:drug/metabolite transporter (DMT)-like permease
MQKPAPGAPRLSPTLVLALGILGSSTASILIRYAQRDAASLVIAAYRLSLATLALLPVLLTRDRDRLRKLTGGELAMILLSGTLLAGHFATWVSSLEFTSVASSIVLVQTAPLMVAALSPLVLRESLSRWLLAGLLVSTIGGGVVALSDVCLWQNGLVCPPLGEWLQGTALKGDALAVGGAVCGAGYLLVGRRLRPRLSLVPYITLTYGVAAVWLTLLAIAAGQPALGYAPRTYLWFLLLAVFPQLLGHSTYNWALRYLPAAVVAISLLGEPVASIGLAAVLLEEIPNSMRLAGGLLTLGGILIATQTRPGRKSG